MQKHVFSLFWHSAMRYPFRTGFAAINTIFTVLASGFAGPFIIAQLLSRMQTGDLTLDTSWPLIGLYVLAQLYGEVIGWRLTLFASWKMEVDAQRDLYQKVFNHLTSQSLSFHANRFGGSLTSQTSKLTGAFERFWDTVLYQLTPVIVSVVATIVILSFFFWQYALFVACMSVIFTGFVFFTSRFMAKLNRKEAQASTAMSGRLADVIANVMTVKAHGAEKTEFDKAYKLSSHWRDRSLASMRGFLVVSTGYSSLIVIINIIALIAAIWASEQHLISIATVYLSITYTFTVARQLWEINNIMRNYNRVLGDAHDMVEILTTSPDVQDSHSAQLAVSQGEILINQVSFAHDGDKDDVLFTDFSLAIPAGQKIGLVGRSGSGKTTLTRLLLRFSDIDKGQILIDGQDISKVTQASLRSSIAYVPQEPMLFHRSLRENIAYSRPNATDEEIRNAAKRANALEFIEKLPKKLDTLVGERGVKLSGGQRQRIAIARAILKDAPILVLDEATSALDSDSERLIQQALKELMKGRTAIVIAHRLSTIQRMDRIVVLENGAVTEEGSHHELVAKQGTYAELWKHQSGGFIEE